MIIQTDVLKDVATKVLAAVDSNELSEITETLELKVIRGILYVNVTNKEYYAQVKLSVPAASDFYATVNANLFLKLVSQTTTPDIELAVSGNALIVKGNGSYKLPLIFDGDELLELPEIDIYNKTVEMDIPSEYLQSILQYNSKELLKGTIAKPVQKFYYVDEKGAITFTSGACVNMFDLEKPVRLLLNNRLVKLFKLFKDESVHFTLGYDALSDEIIQTKVKFETKDISLTAILSCDDTMINSVPVTAIRGRALNMYPYSININKDALTQTINRLMLFNSIGRENIKPYSTFEFDNEGVTIWDVKKENREFIRYNNQVDGLETYTATLDLNDLKITLDNCNEQYLTMNFGDHKAVIIARGHVYNVIPEVHTIR